MINLEHLCNMQKITQDADRNTQMTEQTDRRSTIKQAVDRKIFVVKSDLSKSLTVTGHLRCHSRSEGVLRLRRSPVLHGLRIVYENK